MPSNSVWKTITLKGKVLPPNSRFKHISSLCSSKIFICSSKISTSQKVFSSMNNPEITLPQFFFKKKFCTAFFKDMVKYCTTFHLHVNKMSLLKMHFQFVDELLHVVQFKINILCCFNFADFDCQRQNRKMFMKQIFLAFSIILCVCVCCFFFHIVVFCASAICLFLHKSFYQFNRYM